MKRAASHSREPDPVAYRPTSMRESFSVGGRTSAYRDGIPRPDRKPAARAVAGLVAVLLAATAAGCGHGDDSPTTTGTSPATPSTTATDGTTPLVPSASAPASAPDVRRIEIRISGRAVSPPPGRVNVTRGETVRLVVHSDAADEVHVHGYDREAQVTPGADAVIEFVADQAGLFEVETHKSGLVLTQLVVR
ncbi:hypothetical protein OG799_16195 [Micromonospora sp. NBC_00898]|uniref:hypothetical protein n=1 Tax=Micromonospora sp. NBC_00898 TaxID=2975981 RepID=UPI00386AFC85|nr:hypothetical protein OG799_16195 [Micromonospora sp. NBC_00898]